MPVSTLDRQAFQADPCLPGHPDPYPIYAALRQENPLQWCEGPRLWVVLSYREAAACMRDPRLHRQEHLDKLIQRFGTDRIYQKQKVDLPYMDGEAHAKARQHVLAAYHAIDLQELQQFCDAVLNERLNGIQAGSWLDLMPVLAHPLPLLVNSHLMGVGPEQQQQVLEQVGPFVRARGLTQTEASAKGGDAAMQVYRHFFLPLIQERREHPHQDLLARLIGDPRSRITLSDEQLLLIIASNFYSASLYTVPLLISHMALILSRQPEVYQRLRRFERLEVDEASSQRLVADRFRGFERLIVRFH
jgi:hypothetical protein